TSPFRTRIAKVKQTTTNGIDSTLVKNSFAAMEAAGDGQKYVPMLADFIAHLNGLPSAAAERKG
ncbi:MAG: hypothetical protein MZW92_00290, partial [Comamonadaceae bacterium]|nr:hypothetical protein [Comamonadaceae bacterium]